MQKLAFSQVLQRPQSFEQHSPLDLQGFPSVLHVIPNPQTPAVQTPAQQLEPRTQGSLSAPHEGPPASGRVDASSRVEGASPFTDPASYEVAIASGRAVGDA